MKSGQPTVRSMPRPTPGRRRIPAHGFFQIGRPAATARAARDDSIEKAARESPAPAGGGEYRGIAAGTRLPGLLSHILTGAGATATPRGLEAPMFRWLFGGKTMTPTSFPDPALDLPAQAGGDRTAVLAGGCFWCTEAVFK